MSWALAFEAPLGLLALGLAPLLVLAARRTRQVRVRGRALRVTTTLRAITLIALALALASPRWSWPASGRDVVIVADASASASREAVLAAVTSELAALGPADRVALIAAADGARVVWPLGARPPQPLAGAWAAATAGLDPGASDLAAGLELAAVLPTDAGAGRAREALLVSDGLVTRGDALAAADALAARGWRVRTRAAPPHHPDARVLTLEPTRPWVREGEAVRLRATVAVARGEATVRLERRGGEDEVRRWEQRVAAAEGALELTFVDAASTPGPLRYRLEVVGPAGERDALQAVVPVRRGPRALVVAGAPGTGALVALALEAAGLEVAVGPPGELPLEGPALAALDLVALVDVPLGRSGDAGALGPAAQAALARRVAAGGGLLVLGGARSYGLGDYAGSALEEILPVRSDPPPLERPAAALVLVLDRSASMRGPKLALGKLAAQEAMRTLAPGDALGVIGFHFRAEWAVPLGPAGEAARRAAGLVALWAAGGGTDLVPPLELAVAALREHPARVKHVVAITDGVAGRHEELLALARALAACGATLTTVAVGEDANQRLLAELAAAAGGRHHAALSVQSVPRLVVEEALEASRRVLDQPPFVPRLALPAAPLAGVALSEAPPLRGLAPTRPRAGATVWLTGPEGRPLLAAWDQGAGRVVAWTSDAGARWASAWRDWPGFARLLRQLARHLAPAPPEPEGAGAASARLERGALTLEVEAPPGLAAPALALVGSEPGAPSVNADLEEVAPGRYTARVPTPPAGAWTLTVRDGRRVIYERGLALPPPSPERGALAPARALLHALERAPRGPVPTGRGAPLAPPLLALAAFTLLGEVAVRRAATA